MVAFSPTTDQLVGAIDREIERWLDDRLTKLAHSDVLIEEMRRLIRAGGKRLRPSFCYWGYRAAGGESEEAILRAAASLELLHTFAIVHDDIMDASSERRGVPTVHALHGVPAALLVGDLALVLADDLFVLAGFPESALQRGFRWYARMRQEVISGQFMDLQAAGRELVTEEEARRIAVLKSGRYTVEEPLAIGAALAGASEEWMAALHHFGAPLGEAFQLRDDLLGIFGDPSSTGKPIDSDIREGKRNLLYAKTIAALSGPDRDFFVARWGVGPDLGDDEVERLRKLVEASGARSDTESLLEELTADALDALSHLNATGDAMHALRDLARRATQREA
jgi:geranylgeranyl diphosphate synthase, type I